MTNPTAHPAVEALLDLAAATRPDIDRERLHGAITAASTAGWTWNRTLVTVAQILARGEEPRDLLEAIRDPLRLRPRRTR